VHFKKKSASKKKRLQVRPKKTKIEDDETEQEVRSGLAEVKFIQKYRRRAKGIDSNKLQGIQNDEDEDGLASLAAIVDKEIIPQPNAVKVGVQESFQKEVNQKDVLQAHLESYIEEEIEKRRKGGEDVGRPKEKKEDAKKMNEEDLLYQMPESLKQESSLDEEEVDGERWLAGITEVALPITYKLKNIEETELAKQELFSKKGKRKVQEGPLPANYNADFRRHKREFDRKRREQPNQAGANRNIAPQSTEPPTPDVATPSRPSGEIQTTANHHLRREGGAGNARRTTPYATDDKVLDRFIKKFKWR